MASTLAGGGAGLAMLVTVNWASVAGGETTKVAVAILLIALGVLLYRTQ
jgi:hypothetical protein